LDKDAFQLNIEGVTDLVNSGTNKVGDNPQDQEGVIGEEVDALDLPMEDSELIALKKSWENIYGSYEGKITPRQKQNKAYLYGTQNNGMARLNNKTVPSNLLFEATATFVPQALAKNPEPVVFSDNTEEGKLASNDVKTVLQFLAMTLGLRKKLGLMVWHWSTYFTAVMKYGWDNKTNQIIAEVRKPANFLLDPDGYVDEFGDFKGSFVGERIQSTFKELVDLYPKAKDAQDEQTKDGTLVNRTEWWTDDYCFTTYKDTVLDKHKNEYFNYEEDKPNHFAVPKMPYTFLSVFSMQEQPHDFTNLIEQNISNQDRINMRDMQIEKNLAHGNNSIVVSDVSFTAETAHQAADALEKGDPILAGGNIDSAIKRIPANPLPNGVLDSQQVDKDTLRSIYGTQGLTAQQPDENTTARGMILNQSHDSSRIGGGMGDSLETVATSFFNWMLQLTYVFYDEKHYAAIMGQASAVEYVGLQMVGHERMYVVSVSPNSMQPKDELTQVNQTLEMWKSQAIDPIGLFKGINDPDPMQSAKRLVLWTTNPQLYAQQYFPETAQQQPQDSANTGNPPDQVNPQQGGMEAQTISAPPASASLSSVPINAGVAQPQ
jgi:hypothetical protein